MIAESLPYEHTPLGKLLEYLSQLPSAVRCSAEARVLIIQRFREHVIQIRILRARDRLAAQADPLGLRLSGRAKQRYLREKNDAGRPGWSVQPSTIDDPYNRGKVEKVLKNVNTTIGDRMHARHQIDDAQKRALDKYRKIMEGLEVSSGAIDPAKIRVDSSNAGDPFPGLLDAVRECAAVEAELGKTDSLIMYSIGYQERTMKQTAARLRIFFGRRENPKKITQDQQRYVGKRFRDALSNLAHFWHYMGTMDNHPRRTHPFHAGPPVSPAKGRRATKQKQARQKRA